MKKLVMRIKDMQGEALFPWIAILSAFFLCGAVIGSVAVSGLDQISDRTLGDYISQYAYFYDAGQKGASLLGRALFNAFKYHVAVFLCGFSALGLALIPAIVAARGFFLAFSITVFAKISGASGVLFAAGVLGIPCLLSLPALLLVSARAQLASASLSQLSFGMGKARSYPVFASGYFLLFGACAGLLTLCALYEAFIAPLLAGMMGGLIA